MRLFRFQVRLPRPSFAGLSGRGRLFLYGLYTFLLFLVFLVVNFPHEVLVRRALEQVDLGRWRIEVQAARFAWWKGLELRGVKVRSADVGEHAPWLETGRLYVRPRLSGLLRGELSGLHLDGVMYNGDVEAQWTVENGQRRVALSVSSLELSRYPLVGALLEEGQIVGQLSLFLSLEARDKGVASAEGAGELSLQNGRIAGAHVHGFSLPDLTGCNGGTKVEMKTGRLEVQGLQLDCSELKLTASGTVLVQEDLANSRLNLQLSAEPGAAATEQWKVMAPLIPCGLTGTLAHPRAQACAAGRQAKGRRR